MAKKSEGKLKFMDQVKGRGRWGLGVHPSRPVRMGRLWVAGLEGTMTGRALTCDLQPVPRSLGPWETHLPASCFTRKWWLLWGGSLLPGPHQLQSSGTG